MIRLGSLLLAGALLWAQSEAIRNGGAESDLAGWTGEGNMLALGYGAATWPSPLARGAKYFASESTRSTISQDMPIQAGQKFLASAYLSAAEMNLRFYDAQSRELLHISLRAAASANRALLRQEQLGLVPAGAVRARVDLQVEASGAADQLSLLTWPLAESPATTYFLNLIANPSAEAGPSGQGAEIAVDIPGWARQRAASVAGYRGSGWIGPNDPGPGNRGGQLFHGGPEDSRLYQYLDLSGVARWIDEGQVRFRAAAWLGGAGNQAPSPILKLEFLDWNSSQALREVSLGPVSTDGPALGQRVADGVVPPGTRKVLLSLEMRSFGALADVLEFSVSGPGGPPQISADGVRGAAAFGGGVAAPGTWIEIYGFNLAPTTRGWAPADFNNNLAPRSLDGVSVLVGGRPAFVSYISPTQVNALLPNDVALGTQSVVVRSALGEGGGAVLSVNATAPGFLAPAAFRIQNQQYLAALFADGKTWVLPRGTVTGLDSRPAIPGDKLTTYAIGLGPVSSGLQPGVLATGPQGIIGSLQILVANLPASVDYAGLAPGFVGLYQVNFTVPQVATPANPGLGVPLEIRLNGTRLTQNLVLAIGD